MSCRSLFIHVPDEASFDRWVSPESLQEGGGRRRLGLTSLSSPTRRKTLCTMSFRSRCRTWDGKKRQDGWNNESFPPRFKILSGAQILSASSLIKRGARLLTSSSARSAATAGATVSVTLHTKPLQPLRSVNEIITARRRLFAQRRSCVLAGQPGNTLKRQGDSFALSRPGSSTSARHPARKETHRNALERSYRGGFERPEQFCISPSNFP